MMKWKPRAFSLLLVAVLLLCAMPTISLAGRGAEKLHVINIGHADRDTFYDHNFYEGRWFQISGYAPEGAEIDVKVYEDDKESGSKAKCVYSDHVDSLQGKEYVSDEFELGFVRSATIPYRIDFSVNGKLKHTGYIHRMLLKLNHVRMSTRGIRFRDIKPSVTKQWWMFTPINLHDIKQKGRHEVDLVASNMYLVGKLIIERDGDQYRFRYVDIDTWNQDNDEDVPTGEHAVTDHKIDVSNTSLTLYDSLDDVKRLGRDEAAKRYSFDEWHTIDQPHQLFYFSGDISFDPNNLKRDTNSFDSEFTQHLVDIMDAF